MGEQFVIRAPRSGPPALGRQQCASGRGRTNRRESRNAQRQRIPARARCDRRVTCGSTWSPAKSSPASASWKTRCPRCDRRSSRRSSPPAGQCDGPGRQRWSGYSEAVEVEARADRRGRPGWPRSAALAVCTRDVPGVHRRAGPVHQRERCPARRRRGRCGAELLPAASTPATVVAVHVRDEDPAHATKLGSESASPERSWPSAAAQAQPASISAMLSVDDRVGVHRAQRVPGNGSGIRRREATGSGPAPTRARG